MAGSSVDRAYSSGQSRVTLAALDGGVTHSIPDRPGAGLARPSGVAIGRFAPIRSINPGGRYRETVAPALASAGMNSPRARATAVAAARMLFDLLISSLLVMCGNQSFGTSRSPGNEERGGGPIGAAVAEGIVWMR